MIVATPKGQESAVEEQSKIIRGRQGGDTI